MNAHTFRLAFSLSHKKSVMVSLRVLCVRLLLFFRSHSNTIHRLSWCFYVGFFLSFSYMQYLFFFYCSSLAVRIIFNLVFLFLISIQMQGIKFFLIIFICVQCTNMLKLWSFLILLNLGRCNPQKREYSKCNSSLS